MYKKRIVDEILKLKLKSSGAVLIEGPKWCGKTTTASKASNSVIYLNDPNKESAYSFIIDTEPTRLLSGDTPRLIDEWQLFPKLWDTIRFEVDHRENSAGQFILTGSSVPVSTESIKHSGAGRFSWLKMRPMSLYESEESSGEVSLKDLFENKDSIYGTNTIDIEKLVFLICRGGWPGSLGSYDNSVLEYAYNYYDAIIYNDISRVDNKERNPERIKRLMRSYSRHQGTSVSYEAIANDLKNNEGSSFNSDTISSYVNALEKMFVIEDMPAWNPNLRFKTAIRTSDNRYYVDPSIAVTSLGVGPNDLIYDRETLGLLFETMCVRDLRVYADSLNGTVYHYRDSNGLECDAVLHLRNGSYGLIEIKLGGDKLINEGANNLLKLKSKLDITKMKDPSFLMVLVGVGSYAYKRDDGVLVVPIGCLKN